MQSSDATTPAVPAAITVRPRLFLGVAVLAIAAALALPESVFYPLNRHTAVMSGMFLELFGIKPVIKGLQISSHGFSVQVITECSMLFLGIAYAAFILTVRAPIVVKTKGLLLGLPFLHVANVIRIACVFAVGVHLPRLFEAAHIYLGQIAMILILLATCTAWLEDSAHSEPSSKLTGFVVRCLLLSALPFLLWLVLSRPYVMAGDRIIAMFFALAGRQLIFPYDHLFYFQTFNLVTYATLVLALPDESPTNKALLFLKGCALLIPLHLVFRTSNILLTGFGQEWAIVVGNAVSICGQYLLPLYLVRVNFLRSEKTTGKSLGKVTATALTMALLGMMWPGTSSAAPGSVIIPENVHRKLLNREPQDVIVQFADTEVEIEAERLRRIRGVHRDDSGILTMKVQGYTTIKQRVLTGSEEETVRDYSHLPLALVRVRTAAALERLALRPDVTALYENETIYPLLSQSLPLIGQPQAAAMGMTGVGTTVVVIDTGVNYTLPAFGSCTAPGAPIGCRVSVSLDLATNDNALDSFGHGTNVSGIIAGVAPGAHLAVLDVFNADGTSTDDLILAGINWAIANQATYNIVAINMSLGNGINYNDPCNGKYNKPVNNARAAGIIPVASAGNEGYTNGIASPACTPGVVSVGAVYDANVGSRSWSLPGNSSCTDTTTAADKVTCFSDSAYFLTLLAPGSLITAAGSTYSGTSQAAPHVAGAIAVLHSAFPLETVDQTITRLTANGVSVTDPRNGIVTPRLNLFTAISAPGSSPAADLSLALTGPSGSVFVGDDHPFDVTVTNNGPSSAANSALTITLPAGTTAQSLPTPCSVAGNIVSCSLGTIGSNSTSDIAIILRPAIVGTVTVAATITSDTTDPVSGNNSAQQSISVAALPPPVVPALSGLGLVVSLLALSSIALLRKSFRRI